MTSSFQAGKTVVRKRESKWGERMELEKFYGEGKLEKSVAWGEGKNPMREGGFLERSFKPSGLDLFVGGPCEKKG